MKRLLVVEDNSGDYYLLREAIRVAGIDCEIIHCMDGQSAIQLIERGEAGSLDIALLDLNLPKRNGIDVLKTIRACPDTATLPTVILTSSDSAAERRNATELGANCYLVKPLLLEEFEQIGVYLRELLTAQVA